MDIEFISVALAWGHCILGGNIHNATYSFHSFIHSPIQLKFICIVLLIIAVYIHCTDKK